jgi:DNA-binding SARP family transcriptional activator
MPSRAASLLAYLVLHPESAHLRQRLAFLLWPDSTEAQARTNLRHVLHDLRHALPDADRFLDATGRALRWRTDAPYWLDVDAFTEALTRADAEDGATAVAALHEAVSCYTGDLLDGCYDDWVLGEREGLRTRFLEALERLAALLEERGEYAEAIGHVDRLLRDDPLREAAYRRLMRLHAARGDQARALRVYHTCATILEQELGVEPSSATREAYEALLWRQTVDTGEPQERARGGGVPLVGRVGEWGRLTTLWRAAESGRSHVVLVSGEPGIGKTRLVEELRSWCEQRGAIAVEARSYAAEGALAYGPLVAWLRAEPIRARLARLDRGDRSELARLLPELLAEQPDLARPESLPELDLRQRLFDAAARALLASGGPCLFVADDVQWSDRETLHFLHYLLRSTPDAPLLVAATARHEELDRDHPLHDLRAGMQALDRWTEIALARFTVEETAALAERISEQPLPRPALDRLHRETEGNPLFVVEAVRAGWTSDDAGQRWLSPKLQAAIEFRLGQLSEPTQEVVAAAATIGREFTAELLAAASELHEDAVVRSLDELWRRRIIRERGVTAYDFSHDKIREVAYLPLSPPRRKGYHLRIAHALEQSPIRNREAMSGQIAVHYEQAGAFEPASLWYGRAAEAAQQLHAYGEAVRLLTRALDLLRALPETPERRRRELMLLPSLAAPLAWLDGWASPRLAAVQQRALDLARSLDVEPAPSLLHSLAIASLSRRDFAAARELGERVRDRGVRDADDMLLVEADYVLGIAAFWQGELAAARRHFESAVDRYRPEHRRAHLLRFGLDPKVICLSRLGNTLWFLGHTDAAVAAAEAALGLADETGHPFSRTVALVFANMLALEMRDAEGYRAHAAQLAAAQDTHGTRPTRLSNEAVAGYLDVLDGRQEIGLARIQRALDDTSEADHAPGMRAHLGRLLLEACAVAGDARRGLAAADRALATAGADRLWEAETRRLRAEFLTQLDGRAAEVEAELARALAVASRQGARAFELRVATSLLAFRLGQGQDRGIGEARDRLTAIVAEFPEPHDTYDLRAAMLHLGRV